MNEQPLPWPASMDVVKHRNAVALERALTHVCITYESTPLVRESAQSFMNSMPPPIRRTFAQNLAETKAMLEAQPVRVRNDFIARYVANLMTMRR